MAKGVVVVEVLVAQGDAEDPLGQHGLLVMGDQTGSRGSGMAASRASKRPRRRSTWRSSRAPASVVSRPPRSRRRGLEPEAGEGEGSRLQSVIAVAWLLGDGSC